MSILNSLLSLHGIHPPVININNTELQAKNRQYE